MSNSLFNTLCSDLVHMIILPRKMLIQMELFLFRKKNTLGYAGDFRLCLVFKVEWGTLCQNRSTTFTALLNIV